MVWTHIIFKCLKGKSATKKEKKGDNHDQTHESKNS